MKNMIIVTVILSLFLCLFCMESKAQRRLPGQRGIQLSGGWADGYGLSSNKKPSYYGSIALSNYTKNYDKWLYGIEFFEKKYCYRCRKVPVTQITLEGGYYHNFLSDRGKNVFFNIGLAGLAGYETVNWGKKNFPDGALLKNKDRFVAGGAVTFEMETYVRDNLIVLINVRERFLNSGVAKWHFQTGIGVKYIYK